MTIAQCKHISLPPLPPTIPAKAEKAAGVAVRESSIRIKAAFRDLSNAVEKWHKTYSPISDLRKEVKSVATCTAIHHEDDDDDDDDDDDYDDDYDEDTTLLSSTAYWDASSASSREEDDAYTRGEDDDGDASTFLSRSLRSLEEKDDEFDQFEGQLEMKHSQGCFALSAGNYEDALHHFHSIMCDLYTRLGENHERVGTALHNFAIANLCSGNLDDAMDAIEGAIEIQSRSLGRTHPRVVDSMVELGMILLSMKETDSSLEALHRSLKLRKEELAELYEYSEGDAEVKECTLKIAKTYNNIGCAYFERDDLELALRAFREAISLQSSVFKNFLTLLFGVDSTNPEVGTMVATMCNKAYADIELDNFASAIKMLKQSIQIQKSISNPRSKLLQTSLDNLGYAQVMLGHYKPALQAYNEIWDAIKDDEVSDEKAAILRKKIICHVQLRQYQIALQLLRELYTMQEDLECDAELKEATHKLLFYVNYEMLRLPNLKDASNVSEAWGCGTLIDVEEEDVDWDAWIVGKPQNTCKLSGHKITAA